MTFQDIVEAAARHRSAAFTMKVARRRFRYERRLYPGVSFRVWARRTYNPHGAAGKLEVIVRKVAT